MGSPEACFSEGKNKRSILGWGTLKKNRASKYLLPPQQRRAALLASVASYRKGNMPCGKPKAKKAALRLFDRTMTLLL